MANKKEEIKRKAENAAVQLGKIKEREEALKKREEALERKGKGGWKGVGKRIWKEIEEGAKALYGAESKKAESKKVRIERIKKRIELAKNKLKDQKDTINKINEQKEIIDAIEKTQDNDERQKKENELEELYQEACKELGLIIEKDIMIFALKEPQKSRLLVSSEMSSPKVLSDKAEKQAQDAAAKKLGFKDYQEFENAEKDLKKMKDANTSEFQALQNLHNNINNVDAAISDVAAVIQTKRLPTSQMNHIEVALVESALRGLNLDQLKVIQEIILRDEQNPQGEHIDLSHVLPQIGQAGKVKGDYLRSAFKNILHGQAMQNSAHLAKAAKGESFTMTEFVNGKKREVTFSVSEDLKEVAGRSLGEYKSMLVGIFNENLSQEDRERLEEKYENMTKGKGEDFQVKPGELISKAGLERIFAEEIKNDRAFEFLMGLPLTKKEMGKYWRKLRY